MKMVMLFSREKFLTDNLYKVLEWTGMLENDLFCFTPKNTIGQLQACIGYTEGSGMTVDREDYELDEDANVQRKVFEKFTLVELQVVMLRYYLESYVCKVVAAGRVLICLLLGRFWWSILERLILNETNFLRGMVKFRIGSSPVIDCLRIIERRLIIRSVMQEFEGTRRRISFDDEKGIVVTS
jgi:hypothetical protein